MRVKAVWLAFVGLAYLRGDCPMNRATQQCWRCCGCSTTIAGRAGARRARRSAVPERTRYCRWRAASSSGVQRAHGAARVPSSACRRAANAASTMMPKKCKAGRCMSAGANARGRSYARISKMARYSMVSRHSRERRVCAVRVARALHARVAVIGRRHRYSGRGPQMR